MQSYPAFTDGSVLLGIQNTLRIDRVSENFFNIPLFLKNDLLFGLPFVQREYCSPQRIKLVV